MKMPLLALAAGLLAMSAATASALPASTAGTLQVNATSATEQVVHQRGHLRAKQRLSTEPSHRTHSNRRWRSNNHNDHRFDNYRGWNRYSRRPSRWQNRGCVAVGPIWFCP